MTVIVWIAASVAVLYTLCFAARVSLAFEGGGPFPFEIEGFSHTKFSDKCFQDGKVLLFGGNGSTFRIGVNESLKYAYGCPNGYVVIQAESGSPNGAPLNASDFGTTAKIILAGAILPNERNDSLLDKACSSDFSEGYPLEIWCYESLVIFYDSNSRSFLEPIDVALTFSNFRDADNFYKVVDWAVDTGYNDTNVWQLYQSLSTIMYTLKEAIFSGTEDEGNFDGGAPNNVFQRKINGGTDVWVNVTGDHCYATDSSWIFTWYKVAQGPEIIDHHNSFQIALSCMDIDEDLVSDKCIIFWDYFELEYIFQYPGEFMTAGITIPTMDNFALNYSGTADAANLVDESNVGVPGLWLFEINQNPGLNSLPPVHRYIPLVKIQHITPTSDGVQVNVDTIDQVTAATDTGCVSEDGTDTNCPTAVFGVWASSSSKVLPTVTGLLSGSRYTISYDVTQTIYSTVTSHEVTFCTKPLADFVVSKVDDTTAEINVPGDLFDEANASFSPADVTAIGFGPSDLPLIVSGLTSGQDYDIAISFVMGSITDCGDGGGVASEKTITYSPGSIEALAVSLAVLSHDSANITVAASPGTSATLVDIQATCSSSVDTDCDTAATIDVNPTESDPGWVEMTDLQPGSPYLLSIEQSTFDGTPNTLHSTGFTFCTKPNPVLILEKVSETSMEFHVAANGGRFETGTVVRTVPSGLTIADFTPDDLPKTVSGLTGGQDYELVFQFSVSGGCGAGGDATSEEITVLYSSDMVALDLGLVESTASTANFTVTDRVGSSAVSNFQASCDPDMESDRPVCESAEYESNVVASATGWLQMSELESGVAYVVTIDSATVDGAANTEITNSVLTFCTKPDAPVVEFARVDSTSMQINIHQDSGNFERVVATFEPSLPRETFMASELPKTVTGLTSGQDYEVTVRLQVGFNMDCGEQRTVSSASSISTYEPDRYANVNLAVTDYQEDKVTISVAAADAPAAISDIDADCFSEVDRDCNENADIRTDSAVDPSVVVIDGLQSGTIYEMTIESSLFGNIPPKKLHYQTITACTTPLMITGEMDIYKQDDSTMIIDIKDDAGNFDATVVTFTPPEDVSQVLINRNQMPFELNINTTIDYSMSFEFFVGVDPPHCQGDQNISSLQPMVYEFRSSATKLAAKAVIFLLSAIAWIVAL